MRIGGVHFARRAPPHDCPNHRRRVASKRLKIPEARGAARAMVTARVHVRSQRREKCRHRSGIVLANSRVVLLRWALEFRLAPRDIERRNVTALRRAPSMRARRDHDAPGPGFVHAWVPRVRFRMKSEGNEATCTGAATRQPLPCESSLTPHPGARGMCQTDRSRKPRPATACAPPELRRAGRDCITGGGWRAQQDSFAKAPAPSLGEPSRRSRARSMRRRRMARSDGLPRSSRGDHARAEAGAPGRTRTCDPRLRRPMLYPTELRALAARS